MSGAVDFSILEALTDKQRATSPVEPFVGGQATKPTQASNNASQRPTEAAGGMYSKLAAEQREKDRQRDAAARKLEVYRDHQAAIRQAGTLMGEILKGINAGERPEVLLLTACKVLGSMTGDALYHETARQGLIAIYGVGLLEPLPLEWELDDIRRRLAMLTRPELEGEPEESRRRIQTAIKAHEARAARLEALIIQDTQDTRDTIDT